MNTHWLYDPVFLVMEDNINDFRQPYAKIYYLVICCFIINFPLFQQRPHPVSTAVNCFTHASEPHLLLGYAHLHRLYSVHLLVNIIGKALRRQLYIQPVYRS